MDLHFPGHFALEHAPDAITCLWAIRVHPLVAEDADETPDGYEEHGNTAKTDTALNTDKIHVCPMPLYASASPSQLWWRTCQSPRMKGLWDYSALTLRVSETYYSEITSGGDQCIDWRMRVQLTLRVAVLRLSRFCSISLDLSRCAGLICSRCEYSTFLDSITLAERSIRTDLYIFHEGEGITMGMHTTGYLNGQCQFILLRFNA